MKRKGAGGEDGFSRLKKIFDALHGPDGCPWDRAQTFETLLPMLREETGEFERAVTAGDTENMKEELGDILLLVMFNAEIAAARGLFDIKAVIDALAEKLVRRHGHVFGSETAGTPGEAIALWRRKKDEEKAGSA